MVETLDRENSGQLRQARLNLVLGVSGLTCAAVLIYPKAARLVDGDLTALGVGAVANLALVFGSLMFLRNWRLFRAAAPSAESRVPSPESEK